MNACFCCAKFSFFHTKPRDWLGETSLKWSILCRVGRKTTIQPVNNQSSGSRDALFTCFDLCTQHDADTARRAGPSVCGRRDACTNNFRSTQVLYLLNFTRRMYENVIYATEHIEATNLAEHSSLFELGNRSVVVLGWQHLQAAVTHVRECQLCRVAGNTVWSYMACEFP